ncbi:hypothetical protein [Agromyces larvae]|uniref:Uncharacterized protein n=1 Tax=Agromyces larvae TaxID=2929802 RepID=A0ABY4CB22_9MICO|nr:hypothetical protein [Agromyces larvae]UOE45895.1 hypothetical protein MTO99_09190 [Agromyces larvae]
MIEQTETTVEIHTVSYSMTTPSGSSLAASLTDGMVAVRYEGPEGYSTTTLPLDAIPSAIALLGSLLASAAPAPVEPEPDDAQ